MDGFKERRERVVNSQIMRGLADIELQRDQHAITDAELIEVQEFVCVIEPMIRADDAEAAVLARKGSERTGPCLELHLGEERAFLRVQQLHGKGGQICAQRENALLRGGTGSEIEVVLLRAPLQNPSGGLHA